MACASLVQIANSIIQWEVLCMAMLHRQLVRPQLLCVCWHMYHRIQKYHLTVAREGLGGLPILIPSKYPLLKGALRERRPKPSSVFSFMLPPILDWSNYLQQHLRIRSCTGLLPHLWALHTGACFNMYCIQAGKSSCLFGMLICPPLKTGTNLPYLNICMEPTHTSGHSNPFE